MDYIINYNKSLHYFYDDGFKLSDKVFMKDYKIKK